MTELKFIPALRYRSLTRFYDPAVRWALREREFKAQLVEQASVAPGHRVLDLGCGTATLSLMVKRTQPKAHVVGIDADPDILRIARQKTGRSGLDVKFEQAMVSALPFPDKAFDRVLSSLLLHHLSRTNKLGTLREAFRVLQSDGELHVADWSTPCTVVSKVGFFFVRMLDGFENTRDNAQGLLPQLFRDAGFRNVLETGRYTTVFGDLTLYSAKR
jgi:ubiquinone/menaquinone biosynthesis C-methylase UbiE